MSFIGTLGYYLTYEPRESNIIYLEDYITKRDKLYTFVEAIPLRWWFIPRTHEDVKFKLEQMNKINLRTIHNRRVMSKSNLISLPPPA